MFACDADSIFSMARPVTTFLEISSFVGTSPISHTQGPIVNLARSMIAIWDSVKSAGQPSEL